MSNLFINQTLLSTVCKELLVDLKSVITDVPENEKFPPELSKKLQIQASIANSAKMRSVKRFYNLLVEVFKKYESTTPSTQDLDIVKRSLRYLANHLEEIFHSQKNTPIALTRVFTQLESLVDRASSNTLAGELFLPCAPDWSLLPDRDTTLSVEEFKAAIKQHIGTYTEACVKFTKDGANVENATILRQVLVTLEPKVTFKSYWLVFDSAIAILDRVIKTSTVDNTSKWVAARLKSELDAILNGSESPDESNLSMLLYFVAKYPSDSSARIKKLKENYLLANFLADPAGVDPENVAKFQQVLARLNEVWEQTVRQDKLDSVAKFIVDLAKNAHVVKNAGFSLLIENLKETVDLFPKFSDKNAIRNDFALKGATALLLLEKQLKDGSSLEQATTLANDLRSLFNLTLLENNFSSDEAARNRAAIFKDLVEESLIDLGLLETELQAYLSGNEDKKSLIDQNVRKQKQIFNSVLGKDNSISLSFVKFGELVKPCKEEKDQFALVGVLTKLAQMVEMLKSSEKSALEAASKWLSSFDVQDVQDAEALIDAPKEEDLVEVFLEEGKEIIENLHVNLRNLKHDYMDYEQLKQIHRYFHTLKGAGRMIGLRHFGDVMFAVEDLLKRWNRANKPANDALFAMLKEAVAMVEKDVLNLEREGRIVVNAKSILEQVTILESQAEEESIVVQPEKVVEISLVSTSSVADLPIEEPSLNIVAEDEADVSFTVEDVVVEEVKPAISLAIETPKVEEVKPVISLAVETPKVEEVKPTISLAVETPKVEEVKPAISLAIETPKVEEVKPTISLAVETPKVEEVKPAVSIKVEAPKVEEVKPKVVEKQPEPVSTKPVEEHKPSVDVPSSWQNEPQKKEGFFARLLKFLFGKK